MTTPPSHDGFRVCLFDLAGQRFGLRLDSVSEVVPMAALSRPPAMPSILEGFLNLRGAAVPVVRTAALLGLPQDPLDLHTTLVIARARELPLALLVDRVAGIISLRPEDLLPIAASDSFNGCVDGRLTMAERTAHVLSLDRLLLEKERQILAQFHAAEDQRLRQLDEARA